MRTIILSKIKLANVTKNKTFDCWKYFKLTDKYLTLTLTLKRVYFDNNEYCNLRKKYINL